ncbi:beta-galactosidase small subunit [Gemmatimonadota bacterium]
MSVGSNRLRLFSIIGFVLVGGCSHIHYLDIHTPSLSELAEINSLARDRESRVTLPESRQVVVRALQVSEDSTSFTICRERVLSTTSPEQPIPTAAPWVEVADRRERVSTSSIREIRFTNRRRGSFEGLGLGTVAGATAGIMLDMDRGPHENYEDRKTSAEIGLYHATVANLYHPYIRPQENGNRADVRWISLTNEDGLGLLAVGMPLLSVSAHHYLTDDFDPGDEKAQRHTHDLEPRDLVSLHLDYRQMGLGGDTSWGDRARPPSAVPSARNGVFLPLPAETVLSHRARSRRACQGEVLI